MTSLPDSIQSWIAEIPLPDLASVKAKSAPKLGADLFRSSFGSFGTLWVLTAGGVQELFDHEHHPFRRR